MELLILGLALHTVDFLHYLYELALHLLLQKQQNDNWLSALDLT